MSLTAEQLEMRRTGLGASEFAAVCGVNPWRAPIDIWLEKTGRAEPQPETAAMRAGNRFEPMIAQWYAEEVGGVLEQGTTLRHPTENWIFATPDYFVAIPDDPRRLVEVKYVGARVAHHWADGIPEYVVVQVTIQEHVTEIPRADVSAYLELPDWRILPCPYDPDLAAALVDIGRDFWTNHVLPDKPPPIDSSSSYRSYLAKRWPRDLLPMKRAPEEAAQWVAQRRQAQHDIVVADERKSEAENQLRSLIGEHEGLLGEGWRVTWRRSKSSGTDWKGLAHELGATAEQIEKFARAGTRRFRLDEV